VDDQDSGDAVAHPIPGLLGRLLSHLATCVLADVAVGLLCPG
jgi:hypothetical protein